jgi:hypothetical protein
MTRINKINRMEELPFVKNSSPVNPENPVTPVHFF